MLQYPPSSHLEGDVGVLLVEVVEELAELRVGHLPVLLAPEVELAEVRVEGEGDALEEGRLADDLAKLGCGRNAGKSKKNIKKLV